MSPDFEVSANLRFWPVLEIATFELLAENRPFGIAQRHQFKCNGHSPLVAGSTHAPLCSKAAVQCKLLKLSLPTPQRVQMTFNDLERKRIENAMSGFMAKRRPPVHVRSQLDIGYRLVGQSIEIFEIRPQWDDLSVIVERSFATTEAPGCSVSSTIARFSASG